MKANRNRLARTLGAMALTGELLGSGGAWAAATETGMLTVNATVEGACSIGAQTLNFGLINTINVGTAGTVGTPVDVDTDATVAVVCTNGTTGLVTLNDGGNKGTTNRQMLHGTADFIEYHLYSDAYTTEILANSGATTAYTIVGTGVNDTFAVYGRIVAAAITNQPLGAYTDSVTMTITYTP